MPRICIVTPDFVGPVRNGGIGTHCLTLARTLAAEPGIDVTVLFTGPFETAGAAHWRRHYAATGIRFLTPDDVPMPVYPRHGEEAAQRRAFAVDAVLRREAFDVVHFQEWQADGFFAIQAKRAGLAHAATLLTVTMHSSTEWIREGMRAWPRQPVVEAKLAYMERYCCEHADLLLSPSRAMFDWAEGHGWALQAHRRVIPYCYPAAERPAPAGPCDSAHLIFFGRLETRKGLKIFCEAVRQLVATPAHGLRRVTFLGKEGLVDGQRAGAVLAAFRAQVPGLAVDVHTTLDSFQALAWLRRANGLVVMPSLLDNYPFTVIECIENGLTFLAADTGGVPEMTDPRALFRPTARDLAAALQARAGLTATPMAHRYDRAAARAGWLWASSPERLPPVAAPPPAPRVSVCVAHHNHGHYLPQLLASLAETSYASLEVVVVDDGSTEAFSAQVFAEQSERYAARGWTFVRTENGGIGHARNLAARHATGALLVFMDADNVAKPGMVEAFVAGMRHAEVDCLTCHFHAFEGDAAPGAETPVAYAYVPLGPCIEVGAFENVFGDANFCVRREVFLALGGFTEDRETTFEDWEFLAKLALKGHRQDVVPQPLFWYRYAASGFSRRTDLEGNLGRALRPYLELAPPPMRRLIQDLAVPMYHQTHPHILSARRFSPAAQSFARRLFYRVPAAKKLLKWGLHKAHSLYRAIKEA